LQTDTNDTKLILTSTSVIVASYCRRALTSGGETGPRDWLVLPQTRFVVGLRAKNVVRRRFRVSVRQR